MDRELLVEIGCEELPASWLPGLTRQIGDAAKAHLADARLAVDAAVEAYSTPRRLVVTSARVAERQTDFEDVVTGPPVSAAFDAAGHPTRAATGFARKQGVGVDALERIDGPRGQYLAFRRQVRGRPAPEVLPGVLAGVLRDLSFPKAMRWDAWLDDGRGELLFGRPIRWILFLYGGRVVPFEIRRADNAQSPQVQDVRAGAATHGHRFLTTTGRAGRAIKVRSFEDYQSRLLESFVVLSRQERQDRIMRELETKARRLDGRVGSGLVGRSALLEEVPDLVEYPSVMVGFVQQEFLALPPEVWTTTLVHHQHYFPVVDDAGRLKSAFLAVTNTDGANEKTVARNAERVVTARLRDARFFWEADRRTALADRVDRLETIVFHKKLGTYRAKADRLKKLAGWVATEALGVPQAAAPAELAGGLAKADLATEMVGELTELQGTMGGIYAREEGLPEPVWRAIYYHYLPVATEPDGPPSRQDLGEAAVVWAAVSVADKLDTLVGMFLAGEKPTGSRDPFGLRRQAQGLIRVLMDLPALTGLHGKPRLGVLVDAAREGLAGTVEPAEDSASRLRDFLLDRLKYLLEERGFAVDEINAAVPSTVPLDAVSPLDCVLRLRALQAIRHSPDFAALAELFKRVKNITRDVGGSRPDRTALREPAELALAGEIDSLRPVVESAVRNSDYPAAFTEAAKLRPVVDRFFTEVLVMAEDDALRRARVALVTQLRDLVLSLADISEMQYSAAP